MKSAIKNLVLAAPVAASLLLASPDAQAQACYTLVWDNYSPGRCWCFGPQFNGDLTDCAEISTVQIVPCISSNCACGEVCNTGGWYG